LILAMKKEALDGALWRTRFQRDCGLQDVDDTVFVVRSGKFLRVEKGRYMQHSDRVYSVEGAS